ncbi:hypothetical protein D3Z51_11795 [Clostridiaceae bacterium]|nr:hypothetical protein [Clostridiaceae bacterium]RKI12923.1 hypothetical protein D7V81_11245 [bacterium 1XD21-70]
MLILKGRVIRRRLDTMNTLRHSTITIWNFLALKNRCHIIDLLRMQMNDLKERISMSILNEIQEVVILAAGRSRRMESLSKNEPKCLLPYKGEKVLERTVRQIKECGIKKIVITTGYRADIIEKMFADDPIVKTVENKFYEEDVNIYSMSLALSEISGSCAIFEADTIMEDALVKYVLGADFDGKSVWFTRGRFNETQYGGILRTNTKGDITDIRIVSQYQEKYKNYEKLSGIMRVGPGELELFKALVNKYAKTTVKQYFLNAWIENIKLLPGISADITPFEFFTFNKPEEYYQVQRKEIGMLYPSPKTELISVEGLKHIEAFDPKRVQEVYDKIKTDGTWDVPLIVEKKTGLVLDGQHRMEAAKKFGFYRVPAILVNYDDVQVWTLKKEEKVSRQIVLTRILKRHEPYPYKTVKHKFKFSIPDNLQVDFAELKEK